MTTDRQDKPGKRPYVKPELKQVQLVAEEVFITGCKRNVAGSSGPQRSRCRMATGSVECTQRAGAT
jgi:hypothetical protein